MEQTDNLTSVLPLNWEIRIRCQRCGVCIKLPDTLKQKIRTSIRKTAIDGQERTIKKGVTVIQKPET